MKNLKRVAAFLLTLVMAFSLSCPAFAVTHPEGAGEGLRYDIYQIFTGEFLDNPVNPGETLFGNLKYGQDNGWIRVREYNDRGEYVGLGYRDGYRPGDPLSKDDAEWLDECVYNYWYYGNTWYSSDAMLSSIMSEDLVQLRTWDGYLDDWDDREGDIFAYAVTLEELSRMKVAPGFYLITSNYEYLGDHDGVIMDSFILTDEDGYFNYQPKTSSATVTKDIVLEDGTLVKSVTAGTGERIRFRLTATLPKNISDWLGFFAGFEDYLPDGLIVDLESLEVHWGDVDGDWAKQESRPVPQSDDADDDEIEYDDLLEPFDYWEMWRDDYRFYRGYNAALYENVTQAAPEDHQEFISKRGWVYVGDGDEEEAWENAVWYDSYYETEDGVRYYHNNGHYHYDEATGQNVYVGAGWYTHVTGEGDYESCKSPADNGWYNSKFVGGHYEPIEDFIWDPYWYEHVIWDPTMGEPSYVGNYMSVCVGYMFYPYNSYDGSPVPASADTIVVEYDGILSSGSTVSLDNENYVSLYWSNNPYEMIIWDGTGDGYDWGSWNVDHVTWGGHWLIEPEEGSDEGSGECLGVIGDPVVCPAWLACTVDTPDKHVYAKTAGLTIHFDMSDDGVPVGTEFNLERIDGEPTWMLYRDGVWEANPDGAYCKMVDGTVVPSTSIYFGSACAAQGSGRYDFVSFGGRDHEEGDLKGFYMDGEWTSWIGMTGGMDPDDESDVDSVFNSHFAPCPLVLDENGMMVFTGLPVGTYRLSSKNASDKFSSIEFSIGYDEDKGDYSIVLDEASAVLSMRATGFGANDWLFMNFDPVTTEGPVFPYTGGAGVTGLYIAGAACVVLAGLFLAVRRRRAV